MPPDWPKYIRHLPASGLRSELTLGLLQVTAARSAPQVVIRKPNMAKVALCPCWTRLASELAWLNSSAMRTPSQTRLIAKRAAIVGRVRYRIWEEQSRAAVAAAVANQQPDAIQKQQRAARRQARAVRLPHHPGHAVVRPLTARQLSAWHCVRPVSSRRTPALRLHPRGAAAPHCCSHGAPAARYACEAPLAPGHSREGRKHWVARPRLMLGLWKQRC